MQDFCEATVNQRKCAASRKVVRDTLLVRYSIANWIHDSDFIWFNMAMEHCWEKPLRINIDHDIINWPLTLRTDVEQDLAIDRNMRIPMIRTCHGDISGDNAVPIDETIQI